MARIIAISSQVVRGHIGLSAVVPALQALGHEVWPLPTILLSNHPGHANTAGNRIAVEHLGQMLDALLANGWLGEVDGVLTGYLPSADHVAFAARVIARVRAMRPQCLVLCDPILGDDPKGLYIDAAAAEAIRDRLAPLADILTPNRFELAWLTQRPVDNLEQAASAASSLSQCSVVVTSVARLGDDLVTLHVASGQAHAAATPWLPIAPHGTGDLFAGLLLGHVLNGLEESEAMGRAVRGLTIAIDASRDRDELALAGVMGPIAAAHAAPIERLAPDI